MVLDPKFLDQIKGFEGFYAKPYWDHKQWSVGYGSRASGPNDAVDQAEADRRLNNELANAAAIVDRFAPNLDPGTRAALTSLTYNAGSKWTESGLGQAIKRGDMDAARASFLQYNKASGQTLPGLQRRRAGELAWFGQGGNDPRNVAPSGGGYGVDPDGAAGVSGAIHSAQPKDAGVSVPFSMSPATGAFPQPTMMAQTEAAPGFSLPFGMSLGATKPPEIPEAQAPQRSALASLSPRRIDLSQLMQLAGTRRKLGV